MAQPQRAYHRQCFAQGHLQLARGGVHATVDARYRSPASPSKRVPQTARRFRIERVAVNVDRAVLAVREPLQNGNNSRRFDQ